MMESPRAFLRLVHPPDSDDRPGVYELRHPLLEDRVLLAAFDGQHTRVLASVAPADAQRVRAALEQALADMLGPVPLR